MTSNIRQETNKLSGFKLMDENHWLAWYSNNFEDREQEVISEEAHRDFIAKANSGILKMPELWFHHIEGTRHGEAKRLFYVDHFAIAYGIFDDPEINKFVEAMKSWYSEQRMITLSHGFIFYPDYKKNGIYSKIQTFEISTLPAGREANSFTNFSMR